MMEISKSALFERLSLNSHSKDLGLYIHIPFCQKRCHFCAFYLTIHREDRVLMFLSALRQEIELYATQGACHRFPLSTIYFGGGTPTSLQSEQLTTIIADIQRHFLFSPSIEITVEADPDTVSYESLQSLRDGGVNRLSYGVQSLEESEWQQLGRSGVMSTVTRATKMAKDVGFSNVNIDLMYGLPGQTVRTWRRSLEQVIELQPSHVSCYALTIEEGTRFHRDQEQGTLARNDLTLETAMQGEANRYLLSVGYQQYEISNFAQAGFECQHNLRYWSGLNYLGLGPSSQSYMANMRFGNVADLSVYTNSFHSQQLPIDTIDLLTMQEAAREEVIFGLRMNRGVPIRSLEPLVGDSHWKFTVERMIQSGLLKQDQHYLKTTAMGRQFMDTVSLQLL